MTRVISRQSMRRARNHVEIEQENEAEEREKAQKRLTAYQEMADIQLRMILESMMTLKKVDRSRASGIIHETSVNQNETDDLLQKVFSETVMRQQLHSTANQKAAVDVGPQEELRNIAMAKRQDQMYQSQRMTGRLNPSLLGEPEDSQDSEDEQFLFNTYSHSRSQSGVSVIR